MEKYEKRVKAFCVLLDIADAVSGIIPLKCFIFGHKLRLHSGSGIGNATYRCVRCCYTENIDNTENYYNAVHEAHRQVGISAPVFTSEYHTGYYEMLSN